MDDSSIRFGQLSVRGFRRLNDVQLSLRPLSVMIGANGTGKTSVLDVLSLLVFRTRQTEFLDIRSIWFGKCSDI